MKLYGNITSERATKGQGGNKFISIDLSIGDKIKNNVIAKIMLDEHGFLYIRNNKGEEKAVFTIQALDLVEVTNIKGKKQKGDTKLDRLLNDQDNIREQERQDL
jgi:hypothetical protein